MGWEIYDSHPGKARVEVKVNVHTKGVSNGTGSPPPPKKVHVSGLGQKCLLNSWCDCGGERKIWLRYWFWCFPCWSFFLGSSPSEQGKEGKKIVLLFDPYSQWQWGSFGSFFNINFLAECRGKRTEQVRIKKGLPPSPSCACARLHTCMHVRFLARFLTRMPAQYSSFFWVHHGRRGALVTVQSRVHIHIPSPTSAGYIGERRWFQMELPHP